MSLELPKDLWVNILEFIGDKELEYEYLKDFYKPIIKNNNLNPLFSNRLIKGLLTRENKIKNILTECLFKKTYEHQLFILTMNYHLSKKFLENKIDGRSHYSCHQKFFTFTLCKLPNIYIKFTYFSSLFNDKLNEPLNKITVTFENYKIVKYDYTLEVGINKIIKEENEYFLVDNEEYPYYGIILSKNKNIKMGDIKGSFLAQSIFEYDH